MEICAACGEYVPTDKRLHLESGSVLCRWCGIEVSLLLIKNLGGERKHEPKRPSVPPVIRAKVYLRDGYSCRYCGGNKHLTLDHVIPLAQGGENNDSNLVTACYACNTKKRDRTPEEAGMPLTQPEG